MLTSKHLSYQWRGTLSKTEISLMLSDLSSVSSTSEELKDSRVTSHRLDVDSSSVSYLEISSRMLWLLESSMTMPSRTSSVVDLSSFTLHMLVTSPSSASAAVAMVTDDNELTELHLQTQRRSAALTLWLQAAINVQQMSDVGCEFLSS